MPNKINFSRQSFLTLIPRPSPPLLLPKIHSANVPKSKANGASSRLIKGKASKSGKPNLATNSGMSEDDSRKTQKGEVNKMSKCKNCSQSPLTLTLEQGAKKRHFRWATVFLKAQIIPFSGWQQRALELVNTCPLPSTWNQRQTLYILENMIPILLHI